jgi:hypothetical protein
MMTFEEPSQVLDHGWLTLSGGVQGLYTTYRIRQERARREEFPWLVPKTLKLRTEWRDFIEESTLGLMMIALHLSHSSLLVRGVLGHRA